MIFKSPKKNQSKSIAFVDPEKADITKQPGFIEPDLPPAFVAQVLLEKAQILDDLDKLIEKYKDTNPWLIKCLYVIKGSMHYDGCQHLSLTVHEYAVKMRDYMLNQKDK